MDLTELFDSLILPLRQPTGRNLSAIAIPGFTTHRLAKDSDGSPCLLLRQPPTAKVSAPIRLQNLVVSYAVPCVITPPSGEREEGTFTIIRCSNGDPSLFPHFLRILSPIIVSLGTAPTAAAIRRAISGLVELFQALTTPARKSVQGLWAELLVIRRAADPFAAAAAWHGLPQERVDFVSGRQRLEVKSAADRRRTHHFSLAQLIPPADSRLIVASLYVEPVGGGLSLRRLADEVRTLLAHDVQALMHLDGIFYATLGASWNGALDETFDLQLAEESLQFFDAVDIPKVDVTLPAAVTDVRFVSDLRGVPPVLPEDLRNAGALYAVVCPR